MPFMFLLNYYFSYKFSIECFYFFAELKIWYTVCQISSFIMLFFKPVYVIVHFDVTIVPRVDNK